MIQYCPECHLTLAPHDKFTRLFGGIRFHTACLVKYLLRLDAQRRAGKELKRADARTAG